MGPLVKGGPMAHALVEIVCVLSICRLDVNWTLYFSGRALLLKHKRFLISIVKFKRDFRNTQIYLNEPQKRQDV